MIVNMLRRIQEYFYINFQLRKKQKFIDIVRHGCIIFFFQFLPYSLVAIVVNFTLLDMNAGHADT